MFQNNPLLAQLRQQMQDNLPKKEGIIKANDRGFGFLEIDHKTSFFIPPNYMKKCLHGDKITAIIRTENDRDLAEPQELLETSLVRFIGRVKFFNGNLNVSPDHPLLKKQSFRAKTKPALNNIEFKEGDWVVAHLITHPLQNKNNKQDTPRYGNNFSVEISAKIAAVHDKLAPWWVTLAQNDLPHTEPDNPYKTNNQWQLKDDTMLKRIDMTHIPFVTIDGSSTKDMDDALYVEKTAQGNFKLTVAIADPTAYILPDDKLDAIARERGFTIYLPAKNIPMLPRNLADDLCSLIENVERPALCLSVTIDKNGSILDDMQFFAANIKSHARLIYDHVSDWLDHQNTEKWHPNKAIANVVSTLHDFAQARTQFRTLHNIIFPDRPDYNFELNHENELVAVHAKMRRSANKLVEEAMITANICAGIVLQKHFNSGIFNTHAGFKEEKIPEVLELINSKVSNEFTSKSILDLNGFISLRHLVNEHEDAPYLEHRLRKLQAYSEILNTPAPHFAMGLEAYATWTSPIRKYGDMINHRMLKAIILQQEHPTLPDDKLGSQLALHRKHHKIAERNISEWLYSHMLAPEVEKATQFIAEIFDINRTGARVQLIENGAFAFIPGAMIVDNKDRITCDADLGVISIDNLATYKLGDRIAVTLAEVNLESRNLIAKPII